tara:strand:- start:6958 stop:7632 length:675 start_codon:yes stop_codon:yes gene_type:complete
MTTYTLQSIQSNSRKELFQDIDFTKFLTQNNITLNAELLGYFDIDTEHYHLLGYISTLIDDAIIIDSGTHRGGSAIALSFNQSNIVYTYDRCPMRGGIEGNVTNIPKNIKFDPSADITEMIKVEKDHVLNSSIFFLDINHEGPDEIKIFEFLLSNNYNGILILDDIHMNQEMISVWNHIQSTNVIAYDATNIGHLKDNRSGTGIVIFDQSHPCLTKIADIVNKI